MALGTLGGLILATTLCAQEGGAGAAWRGAGPQPCFGPEGGSYQCPQLPGSIAIRAGRLFDSKTGQMLPDQVVLILNDRIAQVGPAAQIKVPDGARVIDLSKETVLPGLIDAHTHMFENPKPGMSRETSTLIAIQNTQLDLHAGFTAARDMSSHSNGYADVDVRDGINQGRIEGPRFQVSGGDHLGRHRAGRDCSDSDDGPARTRTGVNDTRKFGVLLGHPLCLCRSFQQVSRIKA